MQKGALRLAAAAIAATFALVACAPPAPYSGEVPKVRSDVSREYGKSAEVLTRDVGHGVPVLWEVTVDKPTHIPATKTFPEVLCNRVRMTPTFIGDYPVDVTVPLPSFTPVAGEENANYLDDPSLCGTDVNAPTGFTGDLREGREYSFYVAGWDGLYGIAGTGVKLSTPDQTVTWSSGSSR